MVLCRHCLFLTLFTSAAAFAGPGPFWSGWENSRVHACSGTSEFRVQEPCKPFESLDMYKMFHVVLLPNALPYVQTYVGDIDIRVRLYSWVSVTVWDRTSGARIGQVGNWCQEHCGKSDIETSERQWRYVGACVRVCMYIHICVFKLLHNGLLWQLYNIVHMPRYNQVHHVCLSTQDSKQVYGTGNHPFEWRYFNQCL